MTIDNGNHLRVVGQSRGARAICGCSGAEHRLVGPAKAEFPFFDLASREQWTLRINDGRFPWWIFNSGKRVPGTRVLDYLPLARLLWARAGPRGRRGRALHRAAV